MRHRSRCPIRDLLQEQASAFAHAYAKAMLEMLQVPEVRNEAFAHPLRDAYRAAYLSVFATKREWEYHYECSSALSIDSFK